MFCIRELMAPFFPVPSTGYVLPLFGSLEMTIIVTTEKHNHIGRNRTEQIIGRFYIRESMAPDVLPLPLLTCVLNRLRIVTLRISRNDHHSYHRKT
jgi:hypothetical protein